MVHFEFQERGKCCDALTVCESKPGTITLSEPDARLYRGGTAPLERRRNPSILVGELAGQYLVLRVLADKRNISGGRLSLNRVSGILTTSRSLLGRTSACSSHTSFHVGVSYQSRMASPSARIQIQDRRIWGRSADGCSPDLNMSLFGQLDSTMTLKS